MKFTIEANKQEMKANKKDSDEIMTTLLEELKTMFAVLSNQLNTLSSSPTHKDTSTPLDPTIMVTDNRRAPPLEGGNSTKTGGMWILKHDISSQKFYELLTKTELKGDTALDLKNFYNHTKMCLNAVTIIQEDLPPGYQSIKRKSEFDEYFIPDRNHP